LRLHERGDRRRVDPAGKKRANRHVRHELQADCVKQNALQRVGRLALVGEGIGEACRDDVFVAPILLRPPRPFLQLIRFDFENGARVELVDVAIDRTQRRHAGVPQEQRERIAIDRVVEAGAGAQRLELRAEE
jgi:hypothetical protein